MTRDQELWACALAIEREHGQASFLHAAMQIDRLDTEASGNLQACGAKCLSGLRRWTAVKIHTVLAR